MNQIFKLIIATLFTAIFTAIKANAEPKEEITLTISSDGATKDEALKNALRTAIEQAYGAFVSANTTILNDELVKDEIVTVSNGSIKDYKEISSFEKPDGGGYMMTVNATVSLPHLITYAKNHGSECEFAGNTFGMDIKLFNIQKENELKALYNALPEIENLARTTMTWNLTVDEPKIIDFKFNMTDDFGHELTGDYSNIRRVRGELITSDVKYDWGSDPFYLETRIPKLLNLPIKRADGKPDVAKDINVINIMNEMPNGQYALVRFRLSWLPKGYTNEINKVIKSLFKSLSLDYKTAERYRNQGHDIGEISDRYFSGNSDYSFRNSTKELDLWTDSVLTVINRVKNNFEIIDNAGQKSSFNPLEISEWLTKMDFGNMKKSKYMSEKQWELYRKNKPELDYSEYRNNHVVRWGGNEADHITAYKSPDSDLKISTYEQRRHGSPHARWNDLICVGGTGLFHNVSNIRHVGDFFRPIDRYINHWKEEKTDTTWVTYVFIPLSEIGKYSSFKVVPKE